MWTNFCFVEKFKFDQNKNFEQINKLNKFQNQNKLEN
jgi:hypothetical protein